MSACSLAARATLCVAAGLACLPAAAGAQNAEAPATLPAIEVTTSQTKARPKPANKAVAKRNQDGAPANAPSPAPVPAADTAPPPPDGSPLNRAGSLVSPTTAEARAEIQRTPGAVAVVPDTAYKVSTPAITIKDVLDYTPGVFAQPKWGEDTRLSIRGSGLSRNFHLRGVLLYMDGIPISTADGFGDFQEIDPTAYRYVEVYKGANALRFGANSLGGAINFVMPTGHDSALFGARADIGSFGFRKTSVTSGAVAGPVDYAISGTWQQQDGFRDHSDGESLRGSANLGYRLSPNAETRFYLNASDIDQRIPGTVTRQSALTDPERAAAINVLNDWQRNIDALRIANKTSLRLAPDTLVEFGAFNVDRHLMHPIFRWLDYTYDDYGGFARLTHESTLAGFRNRMLVGANRQDGTVDARQFAIGPGARKLGLLSQTDDRAENTSLYAENSFYVLPNVALVGGLQYLHAVRERDVVFTVVGDQAGRNSFEVVSPKAGLVWDVDEGWQVFANVSESGEVPSFGENTVGGAAFQAKVQEAVTYEIGTRGRRENFTWDAAIYRAEIDNELQCLTLVFPGFTNTCSVTNADSTVHQGVELGFGAALFRSILEGGTNPDKLWLNTAYTLNDFRFDDDAVWGNSTLPGAPRHILRAELLYRRPSGLFAGPNIEWVPEAYVIDNANTLQTEGYAIWGAKMGYEGETFTAYIEGRNLADEAYIASASIAGDLGGVDGNYFEPGNGRVVYGGVSVKW